MLNLAVLMVLMACSGTTATHEGTVVAAPTAVQTEKSHPRRGGDAGHRPNLKAPDSPTLTKVAPVSPYQLREWHRWILSDLANWGTMLDAL